MLSTELSSSLQNQRGRPKRATTSQLKREGRQINDIKNDGMYQSNHQQIIQDQASPAANEICTWQVGQFNGTIITMMYSNHQNNRTNNV